MLSEEQGKTPLAAVRRTNSGLTQEGWGNDFHHWAGLRNFPLLSFPTHNWAELRGRRRIFFRKPQYESFSPHIFLQTLRCAPFTSLFQAGFPPISQHYLYREAALTTARQTQLPAGEQHCPRPPLWASVINLAFQVCLPLRSPHLIQMPASKGISFLMPYPKFVKCAQIRELNLKRGKKLIIHFCEPAKHAQKEHLWMSCKSQTREMSKTKVKKGSLEVTNPALQRHPLKTISSQIYHLHKIHTINLSVCPVSKLSELLSSFISSDFPLSP